MEVKVRLEEVKGLGIPTQAFRPCPQPLLCLEDKEGDRIVPGTAIYELIYLDPGEGVGL